MTYEIIETDYSELSDDELRPILDVANALSRELQPRSVDLTLDEFRMFATQPGMTQHRFIVNDDQGAVVAIGNGRYPDDGTNADLLLTMIRVLEPHRRRGVGTMMLHWLVDLADALSRSQLKGMFMDTVPAGARFAEVVGAQPKMDFHENILRIEDLDRALMDEWSQLGATRAPGYTLRLFEGEIPEEHFDDIAHLYYVLERDMPMPDDFQPRMWNADRVREMQAHFLQGTDSLATLAIHDESGTAVGMSQLIRRHTDPTTWLVTVTMVDPEHRGKSLGKWLKGRVNVAALESWEGGVYQETGNAFTNEAMLAINRAMGFEHEFTVTDCSISVDDARRYLASRER